MSDFLKQYVNANRPKEEDFSLEKYVADSKSKMDKPSNDGRPAQTALESYGNTVLLGNLPQVQALVGGVTDKVLNPAMKLDHELKKQGFRIQGPDDGYIERRDTNIKRQIGLRAENPKAAIAGDVAGLVGGGLLTAGAGSAIKPAAGALGRLERSAAAGATMGALTNPGDVEGEVSPLQLDARFKNSLIGGTLGYVTQGALEGVSIGGKAASNYFKGKAGEKAIAAIGANKADMKKLGEKGAIKLGQDARDAGLVGPLSTPSRIAKNADKMKDEVGEQIGGLIDSADAAGATKVDGTKIGLAILEDPEIIAAKTTPGSGGMYSAALKEAETIASNGEMTLKQAHALRRNIDQNINFNKRRTDLKPGEAEVLYKIRDAINSAMNESVDAMRGSQGANALKKANAQYSKLSRIQSIAENRVAMNSSNRTFGLTDNILAGAGASIGGTIAGPVGAAVGGAIGGGVSKLGRTFGKGVQSSAANVSSKASSGAAAVADALGNSAGQPQMLIAELNQMVNGGSKFEPSRFEEILNNPQLMDMFKDDPSLVDGIEDAMLRAQVRKKIGVREPSSIPKSSESAFERRLKSK
jgi:hypothetical protein